MPPEEQEATGTWVGSGYLYFSCSLQVPARIARFPGQTTWNLHCPFHFRGPELLLDGFHILEHFLPPLNRTIHLLIEADKSRCYRQSRINQPIR